MNRAFQDVRVLEIGQIYNGPYCGLLLAFLGADVIKLEPAGGERLRFRSTDGIETHEFLMLNSDKRSITVDLKHADGKEIFLRLVDEVDVLIENFAPGTMDRLGLGPDTLLERNPRLIYAAGKGYGLEGPYSHMAAMDITVQAMSGTIASTGFPDGPPVKAGPAFIDFLGGIHLFGGIASALYQRERSGRGQLVEVSMHDTVYPTLASALGAIYNVPHRDLPERTGNRHSGLAVAPYNVYRAADGWVAIISVAPKHFDEVMRAAGREDLIDHPDFADWLSRIANMDALDAAIESWTETLDRWSVVGKLEERGVPCAPVLTVREVSEDRHLVERGMIRWVEHPVRGPVPVPASPIRLADSPVEDVQCAPPLAAHTDEVLEALLGLEPDQLAALRAAGAIA
jgi:formyl-CoA transferase